MALPALDHGSEQTPLVVALHGCTQTAQGYALGSGWSEMAERRGFAVLYPEQQRSNNANLCFNWFEPGDTRRDCGEAYSIRQMIGHLVQSQGIDPARVYVTGLSAGGAMANVMLAAYPDLFAGGAIIGGLPYGVADSVAGAFERMQGHNSPSPSTLQSALHSASNHRGPWPTLSVWHGTHDQTVRPRNSEQIVEQWRAVHEAHGEPARTEMLNGHLRKIWSDAGGRAVIESYSIKGMGHGVPLATKGDASPGRTGPYMLEVGISSTARIARSWVSARIQMSAKRKPAPRHKPFPKVLTWHHPSSNGHSVARNLLPALSKKLPMGGSPRSSTMPFARQDCSDDVLQELRWTLCCRRLPFLAGATRRSHGGHP